VAKIKMDFEFDKEIDALLQRQSAQGEAAFTAANPKSQIPNPKSVHLDADEISAFSENALPEKIRQKYTLHLADCEKCRKSLSNLIALDSETENVTIHAGEEKHLIHAPVPWYRKLFAFPNLAYTMGALVLVFSGIAAYTVLQSVNNSQNAEVSQTYEKQPNGKGMSSDGDTAAVESFSSNSAVSSNTMMSNTAAINSASSNSAANFSAIPSAPVITANSNAMVLREDADKDLKAETKTLSPLKKPIDQVRSEDSIDAYAPPPPAKENEYQTDSVQNRQNQAQNSIAQNQTNITPDSRNVQRAPMPALQAQGKSKKAEESRDYEAKKLNVATNIGGKTFKRENNVWYDSAYRGQATVNVTRGSNEYKKLDSGLRGIADNLGGTVVVVWKQKAYRIQ